MDQSIKVFHCSENMLVTPDWFLAINELLFNYENKLLFLSLFLEVKNDVVVQQCDLVHFILLWLRS